MNLSKNAKLTRISNAAAAGTSDINSSSVDMKGFTAAQFIVAFGTITASAVTSIKLQGSSDDSSFSDLEGTSQTVADDDDDQCFIIDVDQPTYRYLRVVVDRGTQNAVVDGIFAQQYRGYDGPVTHDSTTVGGSEFHLSVGAGTA